MLKSPVKREGRWTDIPDAVRKKVHKKKCQVCERTYGQIYLNDKGGFVTPKEHIDHLLPRRWLQEMRDRGIDIDPHDERNLLGTCPSCHGRKKTFEDRLFRGDFVGWIRGLRQLGYPVDRIINFAIGHGIKGFERCLGI